MPILVYLQTNEKTIFSCDWQVYLYIILAIIAVIVGVIAIYKTRKI